MKKFKGTKYAHIGTSYTPALDAEMAKVEAMVMAQMARLNEIAKKVENLNLSHVGE